MQKLKLGRSTSSRTILVQSDLHVGDINAIRSDDTEIGELGMYLPLDKFGRQMLDFWKEMPDKLQKKKTDIFLLNGEPVQGQNIRQYGASCWSTDINDQRADAKKLLHHYKGKFSVALMTKGTGYHAKRNNTSDEEDVADWLNCIPYSAYHSDLVDRHNTMAHDDYYEDERGRTINTKRTDYFIFFKINNTLVNACHGVGFNRNWLYRTTAISKEMALMTGFAKGKFYDPKYDSYVWQRGHVHYYALAGFLHSVGYTNLCMQFPGEYMYKSGMGGADPAIGMSEIIIEPNDEVIVRPHALTGDKYPKPKVIDMNEVLAKVEQGAKKRK